MPRPTLPVTVAATVLLVVGEWAYRVADSILGIPADAEAKAYLNTWWKD